MRKAVAIPYIIALILGVGVVALIGIWLVTSGGKFGGQNIKTACDNKFVVYCAKAGASKTSTEFVNDESGKECGGLVSFQTCSQALGLQQVGPANPAGKSGESGGTGGTEIIDPFKSDVECGTKGQGSTCTTLSGKTCISGMTCKFTTSGCKCRG